MPGAHQAPRKKERAVRADDIRRGGDRERRTRRKAPASRHPAWFVPVMTAVCVLAVLLAACGGFLLYTSRLDTIYPNVLLEGVDVGGRTRTAASLRMEQEAPEGYGGKSVTVRLPLDEELVVPAQSVGLGGTRSEAVELAYGYGRGGNILQNALCYARCLLGRGVNILWEGRGVDDAALRALTDEAAARVNEKLSTAGVDITDEAIVLVKGAGTAHADSGELAELVRDAFARRDYEPLDYEPQMLGEDQTDLQALYDEIYTEPQNAGYDKDTQSVTDSVTGVSFDLDLAKGLLAGARAGARVSIPLVRTEPDITADDMRENMFRDLLAEKATSLSGSSSARINNITLAAEAMNGTVLLPGEEFNYNECLGERTSAKGYQAAGAYSGGKHVSAIGGGICQGSSTLYYCALKANLEITERWEHYFSVSYLPLGMDATVSWGWPDFKFVNSRDWPIRIDSWVADGQLYVQIWGTDVDGSYVDITADGWEDASYYYAQTYRNVYAADGTLISSEPEAYSRYNKYEAE